MYHYRKTRHTYARHNNTDKTQPVCTLCSETNKPRIVLENETMFVLPNRVSYDVFEGRRVLEHLMVVPKRHVETLRDLNAEEKQDFMDVIGNYETKGYNVYARGATSVTRSVAHQHTHLILLDNNKPRLMVFVHKPYYLLKM